MSKIGDWKAGSLSFGLLRNNIITFIIETYRAVICGTVLLEILRTLKILIIFSLECLCAFPMVLCLHCLLVRLNVFWMIFLELVGFWWEVCSSPIAELGLPVDVTYFCLGERSSLHCWRREEGLTVW